MPSSRADRRKSDGSLDLVVVGALTIDRFPDGSAAPGGTVLHAARAAARARVAIGVVTAAGPEPEAQDGLRELRRIAALQVEAVPETLVFHLDERDGPRRLSLHGSVRLRPDPGPLLRLHPRALLLAPVAGELDAIALATIDEAVEARVRVAALQGWLRTRDSNGRVTPLDAGDLPQAVLAELRNCDAVVASHEDLGRSERHPTATAGIALRKLFPGPALLITWGGAGYVRSEAGTREPIVVRRRTAIVGVAATTGAGDAFAAIVAIHLARGASLAAAARAADAAVDRWLARQPGATRRSMTG
ncbi:MAG: carbohydrate kinase family protein [Chloroflexi bacterium]|nr:MAG: carbohydrate kinase family protein [Chloroflexota bacterium]